MTETTPFRTDSRFSQSFPEFPDGVAQKDTIVDVQASAGGFDARFNHLLRADRIGCVVPRRGGALVAVRETGNFSLGVREIVATSEERRICYA
jgi:hypothetical protein